MAHHHHHHHHEHTHPHEPGHFNRAFAIAVVANLLFTGTEATYGFFAHSMSLLADAGHNLGDVLGLALAWLAAWLTNLGNSKKYSYGFKRTTILAAFVNAALLLLTCVLITIESVNKLIHLHTVDEAVMMWVAAIGILVNTFTALLFMSGAKSDLNIKAAFMHLALDALVSVGVVVAGAVIYFTDWVWVDPLVGLAIVVVVVWGTWGLLRDSVDLMLDAVPRWINAEEVEAYLRQLPGVSAVHDMHIWGLSTKGTALTAHLIMPDAYLSDEDYHHIHETMKRNYRIDHVTLQIEKGSETHPCPRVEGCD